ncbi:hypothetical protein MUK42_04996 [Musa troglodytarum]|uniref:Uncharacterized protein n=1 Tax=Musa troglodytarum TaxID=320322 RepID=A0A9E7I0D9_9LILI|nr:hypothetical protein MUK42_04996 [Musa troglodytarum]
MGHDGGLLFPTIHMRGSLSCQRREFLNPSRQKLEVDAIRYPNKLKCDRKFFLRKVIQDVLPVFFISFGVQEAPKRLSSKRCENSNPMEESATKNERNPAEYSWITWYSQDWPSAGVDMGRRPHHLAMLLENLHPLADS